MKTTIYFSALLALIIQVMVKDQTPVAQVISHNSNSSKILQGNIPNITLNDPDIRKFTPALHKNTTIHQKKVVAFSKTSVTNQISPNISSATYQQTILNSGSYSKQVFGYSELQQQAADLKSKSQKLRLAAVNSQGLLRTELNYEANELYKLYILKQIEASEQWAKMAYAKYAENKESIHALLNNYKGNNGTYELAQTLSLEADRFIKLAKEMREEAYAMPALQAKFGTMTNAEEKETLALNDQDKTLGLIKPRVLNYSSNTEFTAYLPKTETLSDLLQDAYDLNAKSRKLSLAANASKGLTKTELIKEANYLYRLYELKEIAASEVSAKITYEKFAQNKNVFNSLISNYNGSRLTSHNAKTLIAEAERYIKLAKEMREEANAMPTIEAKWGTMTNAEEKETLALNKEDKAVEMMKKATPNYSFNVSGEFMANLNTNTK